MKMDQLLCKLTRKESQSDSVSSSSSEKPMCKISYIQCMDDDTNPDEKRRLIGITRMVSSPDELREIFKSTEPKSHSAFSLFDVGYKYEDVLNWESIIQPPKTDLYCLLRQMLDNQVKTDTQVKVGEIFFNCHMIVLQAYSNFFMDMNKACVIKLDTDKITEKAFMIVYQWMLSKDPVLERNDILEIFRAASYLRIPDLLDQCWYYFDDVRNFNENTAAVCYTEAEAIPAYDVLRSLMLLRISKFFLIFVASKEFLEMPEKHLIFLLKSNVIAVNTEIEVFYAAVHWLDYNWEERRPSTSAVIKTIRFHLMPIWYLLRLTRCTETDILQYIVKMPEIDQTVSDAIASVTESMYETTSETELSLSPFYDQRCWIQDVNCPYHSLVGDPTLNELTFAQFRAYLRHLQLQRPNYWSNAFKDIALEHRVQCSISDRTRSERVFDMRVNEFD